MPQVHSPVVRNVAAAAAFFALAAPAAAAKTVDISDNGSTVHLKPGQHLLIRLTDNTDAQHGSVWVSRGEPSGAVLKRTAVESERSKDCVEGEHCALITYGKDPVTTHYKAVGRGRTQVRMVRHTNADNEKVIGRYRLTVIVG